MKQYIHKISIKYRIITIALLLLGIAIWFGGPALIINNQLPLTSPEKRFYIITLFFLVALLEYIFTATSHKQSFTQKNPDIQKKIHLLQARFQGAFKFLKKTFIDKNGVSTNLSKLPCYLLIGPAGAGKTSLLAKANVHYILSKQFKQDKINPSETCDWWATRDLTLIDVPGNFLLPNNTFYWESFLDLIKKYRTNNLINTIIVALPLPEIMKGHGKQIMIDINNHIKKIYALLNKPLSLFIVITKCDLMSGFLEFFSEYSTEELAQAWGITFPFKPENKDNLDLQELFLHRFNALIKRVNSQLLWRLHQERNPNVRPAIKDFPLQLERLKENLADLLKNIVIPARGLNGIYLTSAHQPQEDQTTQLQVINSTSQQALQLLNIPRMPTKAYFIRQFLLQGLLRSFDQLRPAISQKKSRWRKRMAISLSIATILMAALLLGRDFQHSMFNIYAIYNNLTQFQFAIQQSEQRGEHLLKALPLLNALQDATHKNNNLSRFNNILSFYSDKSQKTAEIVYQQALQKIVLPAIKNDLENYLQTPNEKNLGQTYAVLKAYLMLGDQTNLQPDYIVKILKQLLPTTLSDKASEDLSSHIHAASANPVQPLNLNNELITSTRSKLGNLSKADLGMLLLKNLDADYSDNYISLSETLGNPPIFLDKKIINKIPSRYTANALQRILDKEIPAAAAESLKGNWVLGNAESLPNEATMAALIQQMRTRYIENYVTMWELLIANLKLITPRNLSDTDSIIINFTGNASPLLHILQTIKHNTAFTPILNASPKIQALNTLLENAQKNQENTLYQNFVTLRGLHTYIQNIVSSTNADNAAFIAAKNRMQNTSADPITQTHILADENPEPLRTWLHNLAAQSWFFILQDTSHYVENSWQVNIMTLYKSQFSNDDIDIKQFVDFVEKDGIFANYFQNYLKPFVNDIGKEWRWRIVDNQTLRFKNNILIQLQQLLKFQNLSKYVLFTHGRKYLSKHHLQLPASLMKANQSEDN